MDALTKTVRITDFLTDKEIRTCRKHYSSIENKADFNKWCVDTIIAPNIERINQSLGQENDPSFLAYAVEFTLLHETRRNTHVGKRPRKGRRW